MPAKEIIVVDAGTVEKTLEAFENWKLETGNLKKCRGAVFRKFKIQNPTFKILRQHNATQCGVESSTACANNLKIELQSKKNNISNFFRV